MVTPEDAQRLALIRYQLTLALRQAEQPSPRNGLSILGFQDVVESFLYLTAEHLHATVKKNMEFDKLIDAVSDKMPDGQPLQYRGQLLALNQARVNLKHYGNLPDQQTVQRHRTSTAAFLDDETPRVFGIAFGEISLASFIRDTAARDLVEEAERAWSDSDADRAMAALRMAFDQLFRGHRQRTPRRPDRSLLTVKPTFNVPNRIDARKAGLQGIVEWLEALDERMALLSLGVDLRRYVFFITNTPHVAYTFGGASVAPLDPKKVVEIDQQVYGLCRDFVIDVALQFAEVDYEPDGQAQRRASQSAET